MERKTGTIVDILALARSRTSNLEEQARYIQILIDLVKRDYSDEIKTISASKIGFDYQLTGFPSDGVAYFWWNIYRGTQKMASVLEAYKNDMFEVLFSSSPDYKSPIMPMFM